MAAFIHLHAHSYYSFLEGLSSPAELVQAALDDGMPALALTDRNSLSGAIEFYTAGQSAGVKPILGLQAAVTSPLESGPPAGDLVLMAQDLRGWSSLCRLSSSILSDPTHNPDQVLTFQQLAEENEGLICLTGGGQGCLDQLVGMEQLDSAVRYLDHLRELFPGRLYIELQRRTPLEADLSRRMTSIFQGAGIPFVAANQIFYLSSKQAEMQRLVTAIRYNQPISALPASATPPPGSKFTSSEEMQVRFEDIPESLAAASEISDRCQLTLPLDQPRFPQVRLSGDQTAIANLRNKAQAGAVKRYGQLDEQIKDRLEYELEVIEKRGYAPLFLIMEEIVAQARQLGIPISSRGSAASSLVAYCLEITSPDPIKLDLFFERFLNPARKSPPDIDTDICSRRRDEVINYVYQRFGDQHVAMVATINRFRRRSALREAAKAHGYSPQEIQALVNRLPHRWRGGPARRREPPFADLSTRFPAPRYQRLFADAARLIGIPRHLSIHPGGMVISPEPMTDLVPVQLASKGVVITQFDLDSVSRMGLVKIDLLGIRGLTVLGDVAANLQAREPQRFPSPLDALEALPDQDPATAELLRTGQTIGCFQIESPGMRATLKEIQAQDINDLMIALALYRPGPLTGGLKDAFVRRHRGEEQITHLHPALTEILAETYGVILYQEQVLRIAHQLAGLSLADADLLRRAMSHFDPGEQMQTLKLKFVSGAWQRSQVPADIAEHIWELMAAFAGYGFPKAHAASYAQIAWRAAWSKAHHPAVFMASVLANWGGYYRQPVYLNEARRLGLKLQAPHINFSVRHFSVSHIAQQPVLFMGLDQVKDLTRSTQWRIIAGRPFNSLEDFLTRVDPRPKEIDHLIRVGALEGLGEIPGLLLSVEHGGWKGGQMSFFNISEGAEEASQDWSLEEKAAAQKSLLGVSIIAHPLELHREQINNLGTLTTLEAAQHAGQRVRVAGTQFTRAQKRIKDGRSIYLMDVEDLQGMLLLLIPEQIYHRQRSVFSREHPFIVEGEISLAGRFNEPAMRVEKAWRV